MAGKKKKGKKKKKGGKKTGPAKLILPNFVPVHRIKMPLAIHVHHLDDMFLIYSDEYDESRCEFKTWIAAIARYRAIDHLRKAKREEERFAAGSIDEMLVEPGAYDERITAIEEAIESETQSMLSCLSPKDREIMRRIYLEGESVDTVSRAMNITKEQIYNHTSRSKSKLRKALAPGRVI